MIDPITSYFHRNAGHHGPVMLMYHSVIPGCGTPNWLWAVSMQRFMTQLDFLVDEGWKTPTMAQLISTPERWTGRTAIITFDDGYVDNLAAWEELEKRGMLATLFVVSGSIGLNPIWPDDRRPEGRMLNAAELCDMQAAGMEIGSHTVSHSRLTELDDTRLYQELNDSKAIIEDTLSNAISSFAYPYGAFDARCVQAVREAGYRAACTTCSGWAMRDGDPLRIRRVSIFAQDTLGAFARKLAFADNDASLGALLRYAKQRIAARL
jgi:peptidoglycan/xylan/chitin deacetylase (PgdA/CDA1 family)